MQDAGCRQDVSPERASIAMKVALIRALFIYKQRFAPKLRRDTLYDPTVLRVFHANLVASITKCLSVCCSRGSFGHAARETFAGCHLP